MCNHQQEDMLAQLGCPYNDLVICKDSRLLVSIVQDGHLSKLAPVVCTCMCVYVCVYVCVSMLCNHVH